ncbi:hypothetical protein PAMA_005967 [Pampus argenteus]
MSKTGSSETPEVTADIFSPLVQAFVDSLTEDQWELLKLGCPDDATKMLIAELLLEIVQAATNNILVNLKKKHRKKMSENRLQVNLGNTLAQTFADALNMEDQILKIFARKKKVLPQSPWQTVSQNTSQRTTSKGLSDMKAEDGVTNVYVKPIGPMDHGTLEKDPEDLEEKPGALKDTGSLEDDPEVLEDTGSLVEDPEVLVEPPQDSFTAAVQEVIEKAVCEITEPLLKDIEKSDYERLQSESSDKIRTLAKVIARSIEEDVEHLGEQSSQKPTVPLERDNNGREKEEEYVEGNELSIFPRYKNAAGTNISFLTKDLTERIYCYIKYWTIMPHFIPEILMKMEVANPEFDADLHKDVQQKVCCFLALTKWWEKTQAAGHFHRLTHALQEARSTSQSSDSVVQNFIVHSQVKTEEEEEEEKEEEEDQVKREMAKIKLLVEMLVFQVCFKAKVKLSTMQINNIVKRLFERIWAEIEGKQFGVSSQMLEKTFNKAMFSFLVKNWCSAANVLVMMMLEEPVIDDYIASCFSTRLLIQPYTWSTTEEDRNRMHIMFLVQKFVTCVYNKAKVQWTMQAETIDIIKRLFNKIWDKVEGLELRITAETLMSLDKSVLNDLEKQWDASCLHILMNLEGASIDDFIVSSFYSRLMGPAKKENIISKSGWPSAVHTTHRTSHIITIVMSKTGSSETPEVTADIFSPLVQAFVDSLTEDQWELLKLGCPDDATKMLIAELLLEIVQAATNNILVNLKKKHRKKMSENRLQVNLGNTLAQTFADALNMEDQVQCLSSKRLTSLVTEEVEQSVKSILSAQISADPEINEYITPPDRLNRMLKHASKILKIFARKKKVLPQSPRQTVSQNTSQRTTSKGLSDMKAEDGVTNVYVKPIGPMDHGTLEKDPEDLEEKPGALKDTGSLEDDPEVLEDTGSLVEDPEVLVEPPQDSFTAAVQEVIEKAVCEITEPLLKDIEKSDYERLQSESSDKIRTLAKVIARSIEEDVEHLGEQSSQKPTVLLERVGKKIRTFFAKCLAKISLHRMITQLTKKFYHNDDWNKFALGTLTQSVNHLFKDNNGREKEEEYVEGNELSIFPRYKNAAGTNISFLTKDLTERIYCYIKYSTIMPHFIPEILMKMKVANPEFDADLHKDVQQKVCCFLALTKWWEKTQAAGHFHRLTHALQEARSTSQSSDSVVQNFIVHSQVKTEEEEEEEKEEEEDQVKREMAKIKLLVEMLVFQVCFKAKVKLSTMQINNIVKRLFERIWAEIEGKQFGVSSQMLETFNKAMFSFLVKNWCSAANVLVMMMLEEPVIDDYIASCFSTRLLIQPYTWSTTEEDRNRMHIMFLVQKFVTCVYNKAKVQWTMQAETIDIIKRLFNKIWDKVEGLELRITEETLMSLDKSVLNDLEKQWDASCLHILMNLEGASIDDFIVSSFYSRLMGPAKKENIISKSGWNSVQYTELAFF